MFFKVIILSIIGIGYGAQIPSGIPKCKHDDGECLVKVMNGVIQGKYQGISDLGLPSIDPLFIKQLSIIPGGGTGQVKLSIDLTNTNMYGLSNGQYYNVNGFKKDPEGVLEIKIKIPLYQIIGTYKASGQILILPIQGNGQANITLENVDYHVRFLTKKLEKDGKTYLSLAKVKGTFEATRLHMNLKNLFNGNKLLGDTMNQFLNNNWRDILNEFMPAFSASFNGVFKDMMNEFFHNIPYNELFLE
ncbi:unnamed protein product [Diamesa tonsa]